MTEKDSDQEIQQFENVLTFQNYTKSTQIKTQCPICTESCLQILINNALFNKHLESQNLYYLRYMDNIMDDQICEDTVKYKQMAVRDQEEQFLRRMYSLEEYQYKNKAITEYYKFHQDYPKLHQNKVDRIMQYFYDKKKQYEYKKIKRILKDQQDISITTQKSSQVFSDIEEEDKKSNYSNILHDLTQNGSLMIDDQNQSQVLKIMCKKIDKAYQNRKISPLNSKFKSIFEQNNDQEKSQTKKFINYLKKQQQKTEKQEKYKHFIRSNKQSRYNSIQQDTKQYSSGITNSLNIIKNVSKKSNAQTASKNPFFYDGKIFYNGSISKPGILSYKKQQKTKEQTNTPSYQNFDLQVHHLSKAFKKNKQSNQNSSTDQKVYKDEKIQNQIQQFSNFNHVNGKNIKNKFNQKTTQEIYKNATQDMRIKKRSISYTSLANTNSNSKRNSIINFQVLKEKDFEIRNRSSSNGIKLQKQKKSQIDSDLKTNSNTASKLLNLQKSKSSNNFKTISSGMKLFDDKKLISKRETNQLEHGMKKIIIPKQLLKTFKGKSLSTSKLKNQHYRYNINIERQSGKSRQKSSSNGTKENTLRKMSTLAGGKQGRGVEGGNLISTHHSTNTIQIDNLLKKKLSVKVQTNKFRQNKIIII